MKNKKVQLEMIRKENKLKILCPYTTILNVTTDILNNINMVYLFSNKSIWMFGVLSCTDDLIRLLIFTITCINKDPVTISS